jgi:hypothetical protein
MEESSMNERRTFLRALGLGGVSLVFPGLASAGPFRRRRCGGYGYGYGSAMYGGTPMNYNAYYGPPPGQYGAPELYGAPGTNGQPGAYNAFYGPPAGATTALAPLEESYLKQMIPDSWGKPNSNDWGKDRPDVRLVANDPTTKAVEVVVDWRPPTSRDCVLKSGTTLAVHSNGLGVFDARALTTGNGGGHVWHQAFNFRDSSDRDVPIGSTISFLDNLHIVGGFDGPPMNQVNQVISWGDRSFSFDPAQFAAIDLLKTKWLASC